ncbi:hypothetical protein BELL_1614g00020 [Botrytis elliptica]|uniref:Uncharacterized protein n=1 Tax=Botrytis elliptica TaxID=278938 RepID=A0A4Z1I8V8_9HELO|nr:hypothetical protein EAE99_012388 [Botrytis elliptica]TGO53037.1 hypothetical protein BELL_1614g00020 [Botrytis elliptica]
MSNPWLITIRSLLRDLKSSLQHSRTKIAKPDKSQLEQLNISIQQTYHISGLDNFCVIETFLNTKSRQSDINIMAQLFRSEFLTADFASEYVSSLLLAWIEDDMGEQIVDGLRTKWKPVLKFPNDTYTDGIRIERILSLRQQQPLPSRKNPIYISFIVRKEHRSDAVITSTELYTLFCTMARQMKKQSSSHIETIEVRMIVVYSRWVQIITAKSTQAYITSIINGYNDIAGEMQISQTPWFNFSSILGRHCVLLAVFEGIRVRSSDVNVKAQIPDLKAKVSLVDFTIKEQFSMTRKRKISTTEEYENGNKRMKR